MTKGRDSLLSLPLLFSRSLHFASPLLPSRLCLLPRQTELGQLGGDSFLGYPALRLGELRRSGGLPPPERPRGPSEPGPDPPRALSLHPARRRPQKGQVRPTRASG